MKKIILFASLLSSSLFAAESQQLFVGAKGGYQSGIDDAYNSSNPSGAIFGVYGGIHFTRSWSWDLGYQLHNELKADATSVNVKTWLIESAVRYDWYLRGDLSFYGRLGAAYWDMDKTKLSLNNSEAAGLSPLGEVGINYQLNSNVQLSTGYQYIDSIGKSNTGKYDSHGLLVSLTYTFGNETQPVLVETGPVKETVTLTPPPQIQVFSQKTTDIVLGFDSIKINQEYDDQLTEISSVLNSYPQAQAVVVGHADSTGPALYNKKLSERRAQAVTNKLIELNVSPTQLEWWGEGEAKPIEDNNKAEGRAKNRRVEVTIPNFQF